MNSERRGVHVISIILIVSLIIANLISLAFLNNLKSEKKFLEDNLTKTNIEFSNAISSLEQRLASSTLENRDLNDFLTILKARNTDFENLVKEKEAKVANLQKLTETDQELLQKYSKNYFLNENYIPGELSSIDPSFLLRPNIEEQVHTRVKPYLEAMLNKARSDGVNLYVLSAYRSFEVQKNVKARHAVIYGTAANRFSADQGYSEHQLGTTVDLTTHKTGATLSGFEKDPAYEWLRNNAHKFGFTLSYPPDNNFYIFEPWHWRFVGVSLAEYLHAQDKHLYDLEQREIDAYLIKIFD